MKEFPLVSIILLNYNGAEYVNLWKSLFKIDYPNFEIIFIDNGSTDNSFDLFENIVRRMYTTSIKRIIILKLKKNVGYSRANNIGIKKAKGDYVVLLSNDIEVDKNWLKNIISFLQRNPEAGIASPLMFNFYERNKLDYTFAYMNKTGNIFGVSEIIPFGPNKPIEVFFCEGAAMVFRREVLRKTGYLFDPDYFMYYEDVDFCWRARKQGYKCFVVPSSIVYHVRSGTVGRKQLDTRVYNILFVRNRLLTLFRNYNLSNRIKYIPLSILFLLLEATVMLICKKRIKGAINIIKGIALFLIQVPRETKKMDIYCINCDDFANKLLSIRDSIRLMMKKI